MDNENEEIQDLDEPVFYVDQLASRWQRLGASLLDVLIMLPITLPITYFTGGFEGITTHAKPSIGYTLLMGIVGLFVFCLLNGNLLIKNGQTIGKKIVGIKITDLKGNNPGLVQHLIPRYAFYYFIALIPIVGQYISLISVLFIFGEEKRCGHDYIASTKVLQC
jgi:uncharacterized RDD family membrane protein YckC